MVTINAQVVCLDMLESPPSLRCSFRKGSALPLVRGASAKVPRESAVVLDHHLGASDVSIRCP
jgi:hypothetical protein